MSRSWRVLGVGGHVGVVGLHARIPPSQTQTIRETFEFAHRLCSPAPADDSPAAVRAEWAGRVDAVIDVLDLREAQSTVIGNAKVRGVSGGQKKRVTVGVALLSGARVLALDEATSGLDSSTALNLVTFLRQWAHVSRGAVVAALQVRFLTMHAYHIATVNSTHPCHTRVHSVLPLPCRRRRPR